jgi:concentrative nucleoside transporter, CNT family
LERAIGVLGVAVLIAIGVAVSVRPGAIDWRSVAIAMLAQLGIAGFALSLPAGQALFEVLNAGALLFIQAADAGIEFVFGRWPEEVMGAQGQALRLPFVFAVRVLPVIIFMSSVFSVLYHIGFLPRVVTGMAGALRFILPVSGAEALSTAANVFLGMTEAPLMVRPYIGDMTRSELFCVMVGGLASIAGSVLVAYAGMLGPEYAGHLITASLMSAPAAIAFSKIVVPELERPLTAAGGPAVLVPREHVNVIDAAAAGASEGLTLALNIGAMLVAFIAIIHLIDVALGSAGSLVGLPGLSLGRILGFGLSPLAWLLGVPWQDAGAIGTILGVKTALNEFIAYQQLGELRAGLHPRSIVIASYAVCGFANFGSLAILLGGLGGMAPARRRDIAADGLRAVVAGSLASFSTGAIAGLFLSGS